MVAPRSALHFLLAVAYLIQVEILRSTWYLVWYTSVHTWLRIPFLRQLAARMGLVFEVRLPQGTVRGTIAGLRRGADRRTACFTAIPYASLPYRFGASCPITREAHKELYFGGTNGGVKKDSSEQEREQNGTGRRQRGFLFSVARSHGFGQPEVCPQGLLLFNLDSPLIRDIPAMIFNRVFRGKKHKGSEVDSLQINVWAPVPDANKKLAAAKKPVLVYIHGGGFTFGTCHQTMYNGQHLAGTGECVVACFNYRLGVIGNLNLDCPDQDDPDTDPTYIPNRGTHDQITALRWVKDNIAAFGGDPNCVTLAGQSAGSMSVNNLLSVLGQEHNSSAAADVTSSPAESLTNSFTTATSSSAGRRSGASGARSSSVRKRAPGADNRMGTPLNGNGNGTDHFGESLEQQSQGFGKLFHRAFLISGTTHHHCSVKQTHKVVCMAAEEAAKRRGHSPVWLAPWWRAHCTSKLPLALQAQGDADGLPEEAQLCQFDNLDVASFRTHLMTISLAEVMAIQTAIEIRGMKAGRAMDPHFASLLSLRPYVDGKFIIREPPTMEALRNPGSYCDVPILISYTSAEWCFFSQFATITKPIEVLKYRVAQWGYAPAVERQKMQQGPKGSQEERLPSVEQLSYCHKATDPALSDTKKGLGVKHIYPKQRLEEAKKVVAAYESHQDEFARFFPRKSMTVYDAMMSDWQFRLPAFYLANALTGNKSSHQKQLTGSGAAAAGATQRKSPVFMAQFDEPSPLAPHLGAFHVADMHFWMRTFDGAPWGQGHPGPWAESNANALEKQMSGDLLRFMQTGGCSWSQWPRQMRVYGDPTPYRERALFSRLRAGTSEQVPVARDESPSEVSAELSVARGGKQAEGGRPRSFFHHEGVDPHLLRMLSDELMESQSNN